VGISGLVKVGERVLNGQPLCVVHANDQGRLAEAHAILDRTIVVGPGAVPRAALVGEIIG
jgi:thymidine phosphorylase